MTFATGSLVRARGREWVVLPASTDELLLLRPLGGREDEVAGILTALESVETATFGLPDPRSAGDFRSGLLLRDALRLGFTSSAGPFRSFGAIAVDPRPYQLVPLMMALKQETVRLLIADDVGIGKTIEAALIAKELMAQGSAHRVAVLCPPHLAEQWQKELAEKFHIDAELVMPGTVRRLERGLPVNRSLFEAYPNVIVSIDYIKTAQHKNDFIRSCPEIVIVDEAHGCTEGTGAARQQRHQLIKALAADPSRHLVLVTATPHSGKADAFRSLVGLLDPKFAELPDDLTGEENKSKRKELARYVVQRRRGDIRSFLAEDTPFPEREELEVSYTLSEDYRALFDKVLAYVRETVRDPQGGQHRQRVRWWAALGLLRALASSPAAAAATLRERARPADTTTVEEADEVGRRSVFDVEDSETLEGVDVTPGADTGDAEGSTADRRRLNEMAREADALVGARDPKLKAAAPLIADLLKEGFRPIVFCRFIATAEYVAQHLRSLLPKGIEVIAVTGSLPPEERERRVEGLAKTERRVLVATDCLSEGINLQAHFDAVMHYDLSWSPTRHEQREGRVDRYGQRKQVVRALTFYGSDNKIDGLVLRVLLRKSQSIRRGTGVSVPTPESESVMQAIMEGILLQDSADPAEQLRLFEEMFRPREEAFHAEWEQAADRERESRTFFAQGTLPPAVVAEELQAVREAIGSEPDVERFVRSALASAGAALRGDAPLQIDLTPTPRALRDAVGLTGKDQSVRVRFDPRVLEDEIYLSRTAPFVSGLASHVLDTALDPTTKGIASRCGAIRTDAIVRRTTLILARLRFDIETRRKSSVSTQLAEDVLLAAFEGSPEEARWLEQDQAQALFTIEPSGEVPDAVGSLTSILDSFDAVIPALEAAAARRAEELCAAHTRVRAAARESGVSVSVTARLPVDVLGMYVYLPTPKS